MATAPREHVGGLIRYGGDVPIVLKDVVGLQLGPKLLWVILCGIVGQCRSMIIIIGIFFSLGKVHKLR